MSTVIYAATNNGLVITERGEDGWAIRRKALEEMVVTCVAIGDGVILAGMKEGVMRSEDGGETWEEANEGLTAPHSRWITMHPENREQVFLGTEPARLFVSQDAGKSWTERAEVAVLRDQHEWMLPYSPEAGCVRGFALHGERAYAAVEVGGALRSDDGGKTWVLAKGSDGRPSFGRPPKGFVHPDVHDVAVHPANPNLVFAPTGGGFYRSEDGGDTWELLYDCYCRAVWLDADDAEYILLGPAEYVGAQGRIEESRDGGQTWTLASDGLETSWQDTMPERFTQIGEELFCVLDDGRLLAARLDDLKWDYVLEDVSGVNAVVEKK